MPNDRGAQGSGAKDPAPGHPAERSGGGVWAPGESPGKFSRKGKLVIAEYVNALSPSDKARWIDAIERRIAGLDRGIMFDLTRKAFGDDLDLLIMDIERHTKEPAHA